MREVIIASLKQRLSAYDDIVSNSDDEQMVQKLDIPKHKSLGEHLWCVVGARESYAHAISEGDWSGFGCSLVSLTQVDVAKTLKASGENLIKAIEAVQDWTPEREGFLLNLAEHEVMHEGQIIRHLYGLEREIPNTMKWA
jgi:uncharacterized damage-inducible protein DinB